MKKKLLSLLMVTALTASLVAGCGSNGDSKDKSSGSDRETKDVSELVIGEIEYSVIDDGGWAQSMHEGLVKACEDWNRYKDKSSDNGRNLRGRYIPDRVYSGRACR